MNSRIESLPSELQSIYQRYCMLTDTSVSLDSVILSYQNRKKLDEFLTESKYRDEFINHGLKPINRILMYGASGTGKTYLTTALSNYLGYDLLAIDIANALSAGVAAQALSDIFMLANKLENVIIFLDECDAICWARDDTKSSQNDEIRRANNTLFQLLDRLSYKCLFVSATNLYRNLDPAFVRRFNVKMEFNRPTSSDIDPAIKKFLHPDFTYEHNMKPEVKDIILKQVDDYDRLSYHAIRDWVERVEKRAIIDNSKIIREASVYWYLEQELRVQVKVNGNGELYLHQFPKGQYS